MHEVLLCFFSCSVLFHISLSYCNLISADYFYIGALTMKSLQFKAINKVSLTTFKNWSVSSLLTSVFMNQLPFKDPIWHFQMITIMPLWWVLWESSVATIFIIFLSFPLVKKTLQVHYFIVVSVEEKKKYFLWMMNLLFFLGLLFPFRKKKMTPHLYLVIRYWICFESVDWHTQYMYIPK